jgi:6-pyruvoyltetrahydropterin/6-carboxytetrahydropterin synthase
MYFLTIKADFSSAHALRGYEGACERLHGHNWLVEATVKTRELGELGMGIDFKLLKNYLRELCDKLDHRYLNEIPPFDRLNPTSENLARYLAEQLQYLLKDETPTVWVWEVTVWESENARASWRVEENDG